MCQAEGNLPHKKNKDEIIAIHVANLPVLSELPRTDSFLLKKVLNILKFVVESMKYK